MVVIRKQSVRKPTARAIPAVNPAEAQTPPPLNILQAFFASLSGNADTVAATQPKPGAKATGLRRQRIAAKPAAANRSDAQ